MPMKPKVEVTRGRLRRVADLHVVSNVWQSYPTWWLWLKDAPMIPIGLIRRKTYAGDVVHVSALHRYFGETRDVMRWPICVKDARPFQGAYALVRSPAGRLCSGCEAELRRVGVLED